ncbi:iron-sulfur cluster carrier protein ApbC [Marinimicrobium sp. ABcell2]|uniref:iron-sulfur cluster carrier protein ApbC n=1 Tax=Marinimicrobium sp. ABcell2 TaxID=3069751 RepID=UPI0027B86713|nr:iron-sulfur cluster carrier protein ApbC [Marinimicrobium sp. ABcell2]MDQ2078472.1 iron-sulfur cluster carrier protein ApbC [Marinimicrobium sp. ABcell2]
MSEISRESVTQAIQLIEEPTLGRTLLELGIEPRVSVDGDRIEVSITLGYPAEGVSQTLAEAINHAVSGIAGVQSVGVDIGWDIPALGGANTAARTPGVKNIIAVASGKGGVGKSTTAVNLAVALAAEGARVGLLDADIYGPSLPHMLGVGQRRPEIVERDGKQMMLPIQAHGVQSVSMGYLVTEQTPMVWRGPMVSGALQQLLGQTQWDQVDYLIVDMPPGTGDIQLTLSQKVPVTGAVIVTTPQDIALLDAKKGIEMFRKVNVPVLGVVENMAVHVCSNCGHEEHIFGAGGGERIAREYQAELLGSLPLDLAIRETTDAGLPTVAADPDSSLSQHYRRIARRLGARLWQDAAGAQEAPEIVITDD